MNAQNSLTVEQIKCDEKKCFAFENKVEMENCVFCKRNKANKHMQIRIQDNFQTKIQKFGY